MIYHTQITSPIGDLNVASTSKGICMLEFDNQQRIDRAFKEFSSEIINEANEHINVLSKQLTEYFNTTRQSFDIPLDMHGTPFQKKVWQALLEIPYGSTRTYKDQSIAVGDLKAIRAVATANGANKISILIPCHRVIGSDGSLTGFGGGLWRKKYLLELESNQQKLF